MTRDSTDDPRPSGRRAYELALLAVVVAIAAWLRLGRLDLCEYKPDEAKAVDLTLPLVEGRDWPKVGLRSSVGIMNPPLMMYLLAVPLLVDVDPLVATGFVGLLGTLAVALTYFVLRPRFGALAALAAATLFSTAPWAVLYSRKIWAQDFLPILSVALLHCLLAVVERRKTWLALPVPVLACALWQLHFSAFAIVPAIGAVLLYRARSVRFTAVAAGTAVAVAMLAPYLYHQATHDWKDLDRLERLLGRSSSSRPHGEQTSSSRPQGERPSSSHPRGLEAISYTAEIIGASGWSYVTGGSQVAFARTAGAAGTAGQSASVLAQALLLAGFVATAVRVVYRAGLARSYPFVKLSPDDERRAVLLLWLGGIWLAFAVVPLKRVYPHYFILTYPVSFAVIAVALADLAMVVPARAGRVARYAIAAVAGSVALAYVAFNLGFYAFVDENGGTSGDYGTAFRHKDAVARYALRHGLTLDPAPKEVSQLAELRRRYGGFSGAGAGPAPPSGAQRLEVRDRLRDGRPLACPPGHARFFGPMAVCPRP